MGLSTDKINIDFQIIPTGNPTTLAVMDTSTWGMIENKPAIIEISLPNSDKTITHYFDKRRINVFNTSNLYMSAVGDYRDMPDGLYTLVVKGSPDTNCRKRYFLKDDRTKMELYKMYASLGVEESEKTKRHKKDIQHALTLLWGANAKVALGKVIGAAAMLKDVMKILKDYNNCTDC